jgi:peptidoglycan/LPS O-acetylase OafA/YrhL
MSIAAPARTAATVDDRAHISRVPYMPGLDGMRALAVVAVMVYHANSTWLPGGFLGVEMFFVISGYLITLLLIAERERSYRISLKQFWIRRARRLLPAVFTMMLLVTTWTAIFERDALGQLRGDVIAGFFYVSNWYQIWVGLGYTSAGDFAPLRHLWSLAVEEQFYLLWPIVMVLLLGRAGTRRVADVSRWVFAVAVGVTVLMAVLFYPGPTGEPDVTPDAYWWLGDRPISKIDTLYLSTVTRAGGLLLGAAFAMVWRPFALVRGPMRNKGRLFDLFAIAGFVVLGWMCWNIFLVAPSGADSRLFRGGFFVAGLATLAMIAAVAHRGAAANRVLGNRVFLWIGTRSYGLYLYHWPIYQIIRNVAGNKLNFREFALAMVATAIITELSYRLIETPIRKGTFIQSIRRIRRQPTSGPKRIVTGVIALVIAMTLFAGVSLATAPLEENEIARVLDAGEEFTTDLTDTSPGTSSGASSGGGDGASGDPDAVDDDGASGSRSDASENGAVTRVADDDSTRRSSATTTPRTTVAGSVVAGVDDPGDEVVVTTVPATTAPAAAPVVPASTQPPPSTSSALGLVNDMSQLQPMAVPPTDGYHRLIALGDSVMLGAAEELQVLGFAVDAVKSRQMIDFVPTMQQIRDNGTFGSVAVIHLGTNGPFSQETLNAMMATLIDVPVVIILTGKADRGWVAGNNERARALAGTYPNVTILDWEVLSQQCEGTCFYDDGIHLTDSGQQFYAGLVNSVLALG